MNRAHIHEFLKSCLHAKSTRVFDYCSRKLLNKRVGPVIQHAENQNSMSDISMQTQENP